MLAPEEGSPVGPEAASQSVRGMPPAVCLGLGSTECKDISGVLLTPEAAESPSWDWLETGFLLPLSLVGFSWEHVLNKLVP